ncbi:hypothetical protein [Devosia sp.]|uniref:hypothetical protein n=1 Tax=Devosia sp. TaxID=1871048 RepID=UPI0035257855
MAVKLALPIVRSQPDPCTCARAGHLAGIAGVALDQFTDLKPSGTMTTLDLLGENLMPLGVPILGGPPRGHGERAVSVPIGLQRSTAGGVK